jgi:predicted transcriptional regulator
VIELTAQIVSAHVSNNNIGPDELPKLIESVYRSLSAAPQVATALAIREEPAVPVKQSVKPNGIMCLVCGLGPFQMLKRHLNTSHSLGIVEYRQKYDLPRDYPMVAPNYASVRSKLAKQIGLGRIGKTRGRKQPVRKVGNR